MAGLYIHIPYCRRKCSYCDFFSVANTSTVEAYIDAVVAESRLRKDELRGEGLRTIYIGGGTPSVLGIGQIRRLVEGIRSVFDTSEVEEFTIEVNPEGVGREYVEGLRETGINRVSMGIQSFDDEELKMINRRHSAAEAERAVETIREAGIDNISIDLIYGLPLQTMDSWQRTLEKAASLKPNHISAYNLSYEEGTRLWTMRKLGKIAEATEEECEAMFHSLVKQLKAAGYEHYEISNFCLPGFHSRHNSSYWDGTLYLGLGASAHSYDGETRSWNPRNINEYITAITAGRRACECEALTATDKYNEQIMIRLRTAKGVSADFLRQAHGEEAMRRFEQQAERFVQAGMMAKTGAVYRITEAGIMISDHIISHLML